MEYPYSKVETLMAETNKLYTNVKVGKPKDGVVEIHGEIPAETMELHRKDVLLEVRQEVEVPGFRKGNVPEELVLKQIDMNHVLEDAAEEALGVAYPMILDEHSLVPQSSPRVTIVKLALGAPLEFKIAFAIEPEVSLPNYKKIAKAVKGKETAIEVTDQEVADIIAQVTTMRQDKDGKPAELTDEFVKTLGVFESVADFKEKLKDNIAKEKETDARRARYETIAQGLVKDAKVKLPLPLIEDELYAAHTRLHRELEKRKMSEEEYFKLIKKTEEEFMKEKREGVEKQLKTKFVLKAIAAKENIKPEEKEIEQELLHTQKHYPNAEAESFRGYIEEMLTNEKTLVFLEKAEW